MSTESSDLEAPQEVRQSHPEGSRNSWIQASIAVLAVVAIGLSTWALVAQLSGGSGAKDDFSDGQRADAKAQVCTAFTAVRTGVKRNTSMVPPGGPDDFGGTLGVAANARIALYVGGLYLLERVGPATPKELADAVRVFANNLTDIGAAATAGQLDSDPEQAARLKTADEDNTKIAQMCV